MNATEKENDKRLGVIAALSSYGIWGFFPILFHALQSVTPISVVAHRIVWSFFLVGGVLATRGRTSDVIAVFRQKPVLVTLVLSAFLLSVNWLTFVWAVGNGRVLETSFGYFITPLVSVAIGMVFLGERMNLVQWGTLILASIALVIQSVGLNGLPVVSIVLALTFGFYGYLRKTVDVGPTIGLMVETMVLFPIAIAYLCFIIFTQGIGQFIDPKILSLLILTGPVTSFSLILFAYGARRLRLSTMGMFQYIAPSIHFMLAIWMFGEPMNGLQLFSFGLIWVSLALFSYDSFARRSERVRHSIG